MIFDGAYEMHGCQCPERSSAYPVKTIDNPFSMGPTIIHGPLDGNILLFDLIFCGQKGYVYIMVVKAVGHDLDADRTVGNEFSWILLDVMGITWQV